MNVKYSTLQVGVTFEWKMHNGQCAHIQVYERDAKAVSSQVSIIRLRLIERTMIDVHNALAVPDSYASSIALHVA